MPDIVDWQQPPRRHRRLFFLVLAILAIVIFSSRTALSYYVDALWFGRIARLRGRVPEDSHSSMDSLCGIFCCHISFSVRMVPGAEEGLPIRFAGRLQDRHRRGGLEASSPAPPSPPPVAGRPPFPCRACGPPSGRVGFAPPLFVVATRPAVGSAAPP